MKRPGHEAHKISTGQRVRSTQVTGAAHLFVFQDKAQRTDLVIDMDPGNALLTVAQRTASKEAHRERHQRQNPFSAKHDPRTGDHPAHAQRIDNSGGSLPVYGQRGQKVSPGWCVFAQRLFFARPIIPDTGGLDQDLRFF